MSKKAKAASSSRALAGTFPSTSFGASTSTFGAGFGATPISQLSYVYEPPDLSAISDATIVVAWKSLQKKDSTTKTRALDELLAYVAKLEGEKQALEEGFLEAWIKLYARVSIDNARQVRQRSHTLQGRISALLGKRIAKSLPHLVGPWLCGLHDNDKLVVRAAQEALSTLFTTEEKRLGLWKVYHGSILEYCSNAILNEDAKTLSDERTTNKDDAESKFTRTVGSAVLTVARALEILHEDELQKQISQYKLLLDSDQLLALSDSSDVFLRQAVYRLLAQRIEKLNSSVEDSSLKKVSKVILGKGLKRDQTGSIIPYSALLVALTKAHPTLWTNHFSSSKRSASELLQGFFKKLPALPSSEFWDSLRSLVDLIPGEVVVSVATVDKQLSAPVLAAFHHGLVRKENFRAPPASAWDVFLNLSKKHVSSEADQESRELVAQEYLFPLVRQYIIPSQDDASWTISGVSPEQERIALTALALASEAAIATTEKLVQSISFAAIEHMQASLPEQSKGFAESQRQVGNVFDRWGNLKMQLTKFQDSDSLLRAVDTGTEQEIRSAMQLLSDRKGKPFGAVFAIHRNLQYVFSRSLFRGALKTEIISFLTSKTFEFIGTPSTAHILALLQDIDSRDESVQLYNRCLTEVLSGQSSPSRTDAVTFFLKSSWPMDSSLAAKLGTELETSIDTYAKGDTSRLSQLEAALTNKGLPYSFAEAILEALVGSLSIDANTESSLKVLASATEENQDAVGKFLFSSTTGSSLGPKLLVLSQSSKDHAVRQQASDLNARSRMLVGNTTNDPKTISALGQSIREGLTAVTNSSMTVDVLVEIAAQTLQDSDLEATLIHDLLPSEEDWMDAFDPFMLTPPDVSLSITNTLGGAIQWLAPPSNESNRNSAQPLYDASGHSMPVRMVAYTLKLAQKLRIHIAEATNDNKLRSLLTKLITFNEVMSDQISIPAAVPLWTSIANPIEGFATDLLSQSLNFVGTELEGNNELRAVILDDLMRASHGSSTRAYYAARAYVTLASEALELDPLATQWAEDELLKIVRKPSGSFSEAAKFATGQQGSGRSKVANNLVAELSRGDLEIHSLTLLNCLMQSPAFDDVAFNQQHRLVLFVKHIVSAITLDLGPHTIDGEIFRALVAMTPLVKDIFDNLWTNLLEKLIDLFSLPSHGPSVLQPALRLLGVLQDLTKEDETNDDLKEAWIEKQTDLSDALVSLLLSQSEASTASSQPQQIVNSSLARRIDKLGVHSAAAGDLYPVIASSSFDLQKSAFNILHRAIPASQEKVTMDAALTKDFVAKLPEELLSLIKEAPSEVRDLAGAASLPSDLVQYTYAWKLIYDHWTGASYQVQNDYVNAIKEGKHLQGLLDLIFEVTINSRSKPLEASRISFLDFDTNLDEGPERGCQLLICHLYYLSLQHCPGLVRAWWRDECPRALEKPVGDWTERYFSPHIVTAELSEVSSWSTKQETDTPLELKISTRAREVTAMYPIDEQMSSIRISLPENYPLSTIDVQSINRVGVEEKKWQAWKINAQGVMNFAPSSGGLGAVTDGLVGWRRNVTGTLKGQSECAICYSIVNADRQLPTKKCGTCKNAFHGTCLYRWFKSSGGSSCPLCRNAFNYG